MAVSVNEIVPAALVLEESVHAVHTAALYRALDDKSLALEEIAESVIAQLRIVGKAEFYRAFAVRDPLGDGKIGAARLLHERFHILDGEHHILVVLRRVLDRVFGDVRAREAEFVDAVPFVVRDIDNGSSRFDLVCVFANGKRKRGCILSRDHGGISVGTDNVPVVLEVREIDADRTADRKIDVVFKRVAEAVREIPGALLGFRG